MLNEPVDIRRAKERFHTQNFWLDSHHSFSFSRHYDPQNVNHGLLLVNNDDTVKPGSGFSTHPHQDMEIVTWVLSGELEHQDSVGNKGIIYPGLAQRMSAGTGILHSEMNPGEIQNVHFIQMWVLPDTEGVSPEYQQMDINSALDRGGLVPIASGRGHNAGISIHQKDAVLWGARLMPGETVLIPESKYVHVYIARGAATLQDAGVLETGDAVRLTAAGSRSLTANPNGAEVLIWQLGK